MELSGGRAAPEDCDGVDGSASRVKEVPDPGPTKYIRNNSSHNYLKQSPSRRGNTTTGRWRGLANLPFGQEGSEGPLLLPDTEGDLESARPRLAAGDRSLLSLSLSERTSMGSAAFPTERLRFVETERVFVFAAAGAFADVD